MICLPRVCPGKLGKGYLNSAPHHVRRRPDAPIDSVQWRHREHRLDDRKTQHQCWSASSAIAYKPCPHLDTIHCLISRILPPTSQVLNARALTHWSSHPTCVFVTITFEGVPSQSAHPRGLLGVFTMPKKHAPAFTHTKPSYVHPSLESSRASPSQPSEPQTVNQRIQQLRREQAPRATPQQRDELTSPVSRTVPPELRRILHIPEVNAPKPKAGTRMRRAMGGARPPPGPAAPGSWLQQSRHAPAYARNRRKSGGGQSAPRFGTLAKATEQERKVGRPPSRCNHAVLHA